MQPKEKRKEDGWALLVANILEHNERERIKQKEDAIRESISVLQYKERMVSF